MSESVVVAIYSGETGFESSLNVEIPEVLKHEKYEQFFKAGEWSFDLREEDDAQNALNAIGAWIAWYNFLVSKDKK